MSLESENNLLVCSIVQEVILKIYLKRAVLTVVIYKLVTLYSHG